MSFTHGVPTTAEPQRKGRHVESRLRFFRMDSQLEKRVAIEPQAGPVGMKILLDQLEGKDIVTCRNRGVRREDSRINNICNYSA